jgi:iron(III) transport system substrate-binding protein
MFMKKLLASLSNGSLMLFFLASSALADPALYERARKEGQVLVYSSFNAAEMVSLKNAFEKKYPGVKVEHLRLAGAKLMQRILAEHQAGSDLADTVLIKGETMHVLGQKGLLAKYDPLEDDDKNAIDKMFKHPENLWTTVYLGVHSIVYNTRRVSGKDIPRRYTDLLKPQWKDKIGVSTTKYIVTYALMDLYGKEKGMDFLKKLAAQNPVARAGGTLIIELVGAGEFDLGFSVNADSVEAVKRRGAPVDWARLDEPSYGDIQATGVLAKARRPNAARLFSTFLVSKEGQQKIADLSNVVVRKDVEPKIALDRSKLRVIDPVEGNRIDYYMGLINDLFVKAN